LDFLARVADKAEVLPFHIARKKVPFIDAAGKRIEPQKPNAIKYERFIFDLMPWAENAVVVEVDANDHFAPLKNAPGEAKDTPDWVRSQMSDLYTRWLQAAGATVAPHVPVEISPLFALDATEVAEKIHPGTQITEPTYLAPTM
jgi:UDP-N-acetylglucosamine/UDP-N-acetylgalactosamine diphosphorylase